MPAHRHTFFTSFRAICVAALLCPVLGYASSVDRLESLRVEFETVAERVIGNGRPGDDSIPPARIAQLRARVATAPQDDALALELGASELDYGLHLAATRRLGRLLDTGNPIVIDEAACLLARLHFAQGAYSSAYDLLRQAQLDTLGARRDACLLLKGMTEQKLGYSRAAIETMHSIAATSEEYPAAQFNIALAEIRNGWWSDGESRIERLAADLPEHASVERALVDRFYTTVGYSRLERDYYRQSRDAFRQVRRDGPYTERALLGLALAAMQQRRYHQALELARLLAARDSHTLPAEEAHLVVPYILDRMRQDEAAHAAYQQSIDYFQRRIIELDTLSGGSATARDRLHRDLDPSGYQAFHSQVRHIDQLADYARATGRMTPDVAALRQRAADVQRLMLQDAIHARQEHLRSYLSQARYGLAHLLDRANAQQASQ